MKGIVSLLATILAAGLPMILGAKPRHAVTRDVSPYFVECDLAGKHQNEPDRVEAQRELMLVSRIVGDAYPTLPEHLKQIAPKVAYVVVHRNPDPDAVEPEGLVVTKTFMGWSAEDDTKFYKYPDTTFYHPTEGPDGSIRVVFTEKFVQVLDLLFSEHARQNPRLRKGLLLFAHGVVGHELEHAHQYHTEPVRNVNAFRGEIQDGIMPDHLLEDLRQKIEYERDAFATERAIRSQGATSALGPAVDAMEELLRTRPELFEAGARFHLLSSSQPNKPFLEAYLRPWVETLRLGRDLGPQADIYYRGQLVPVEAVRELISINENLESATLSETEALQVQLRVNEIQHRVEKYLGRGLEGAFPYLIEVEHRLLREFDRFAELAGKPTVGPIRDSRSLRSLKDIFLAQGTPALLETIRAVRDHGGMIPTGVGANYPDLPKFLEGEVAKVFGFRLLGDLSTGWEVVSENASLREGDILAGIGFDRVRKEVVLFSGELRHLTSIDFDPSSLLRLDPNSPLCERRRAARSDDAKVFARVADSDDLARRTAVEHPELRSLQETEEERLIRAKMTSRQRAIFDAERTGGKSMKEAIEAVRRSR